MTFYLSRASQALSRSSFQVGSVSRRSMVALADKIKSKEKVEEDRYIRAQENAWKEKLQGLRAVEEHKREAAVHHDVVKPVMDDVSKMLAETGDSVSDAALENLTKWKLDL